MTWLSRLNKTFQLSLIGGWMRCYVKVFKTKLAAEYAYKKAIIGLFAGANASRIQVRVDSTQGIPKDVKCLGEIYQRISELVKHHKKRKKGKQNSQDENLPDYYYVDR